MTVFLGCGFAAKYREGGGVFSVPLQWMLGLKRLQLDAVWLRQLCREAGAQLIVNDRADIAMLLDAGLHLGQDDLAPRDARRLM